ncbi:hypothetical protein Tco_1530557 [Tanacetum coccineum]
MMGVSTRILAGQSGQNNVCSHGGFRSPFIRFHICTSEPPNFKVETIYLHQNLKLQDIGKPSFLNELRSTIRCDVLLLPRVGLNCTIMLKIPGQKCCNNMKVQIEKESEERGGNRNQATRSFAVTKDGAKDGVQLVVIDINGGCFHGRGDLTYGVDINQIR